jgi:hypothetical protein
MNNNLFNYIYGILGCITSLSLSYFFMGIGLCTSIHNLSIISTLIAIISMFKLNVFQRITEVALGLGFFIIYLIYYGDIYLSVAFSYFIGLWLYSLSTAGSLTLQRSVLPVSYNRALISCNNLLLCGRLFIYANYKSQLWTAIDLSINIIIVIISTLGIFNSTQYKNTSNLWSYFFQMTIGILGAIYFIRNYNGYF